MSFQEGLSCGGAYIKLLSQSDKLKLVGISFLFSKMVEILVYRKMFKRRLLIQ